MCNIQHLSLSKQTLMKSNAQLQREDSDDDMPAAMHVAFLDVASSSHTVPPSEPEANYSQIMEALAAIQGGMSTMQQSISLCILKCRPSTSGWSRPIWTFRSAFESIILIAVMMRMLQLRLYTC
jgi:hypothetical protein